MSYGSTVGVAAIVPAAATAGGFSATTTPTSTQVTTWLGEGYSIIHQYVSAAGYTVPVGASADAYPSLTALENLYAAAYTLRARGMDVVSGSNENKSETMLEDFFTRLKVLVSQDLTALGVTVRTSPRVQRRRVRSGQWRKVDGYSGTYSGTIPAYDSVSE